MNYNVEIIKPDVYRIDEFGLGTMYFIKGEKKGLLIDTGTGVQYISEVIKTLTDTNYDVVLTHGHVDHAGGIGQFNTVYLHPNDFQMASDLTLEERQAYVQAMIDTYPNYPVTIKDVTNYQNKPELIAINKGHIFDLGNKIIEVFEVPGHTDGSIFLLDKTDQILFSGDSLQHLELLVRENESRKEVVSIWLDHIQTIKKHQQDFDTICGGHEPLEIEIIDSLIACGKGIIDGSLKPSHQKIHIFEGDFTTYKNVNITYQLMHEIE